MSNIVDHPEEYFRDLIPARDEILLELEAEAERENIPIVGPLVGEFLFILARAIKAQNILELGTATGYSAIYLGRACNAVNGRVLTLEMDPSKAARARRNLHKTGLGERVEVQTGDALATLNRLKDEFDLIFIDIFKQDYPKVLPDCHRLLKKGGLLVADNVGFKDADEFNRTISEHTGWRSIAMFGHMPLHSPEHDALCLALRL